jgi:hypothetical protein
MIKIELKDLNINCCKIQHIHKVPHILRQADSLEDKDVFE